MSKTKKSQPQKSQPQKNRGTREELSDEQLAGVSGGIIAVLIGQCDGRPMESISFNYGKLGVENPTTLASK